MITVYTVSKQDFPATRIHLPSTQWGFSVQERLSQMGFAVDYSGLGPDTDIENSRGPEELARRDALLELTGL